MESTATMHNPMFLIALLGTASATLASDWLPTEQVPANLAGQISPACSGAFVDGFLPINDGNIYFQADSSQYDMVTEQFQLIGNASVEQNNQWIAGDKILFNRESGIGDITGGYQARQPGLFASGSQAGLDAQGTYSANDGEFVLHDNQLHGNAKTYQQSSEGKIRLRNVTFSRCEPGNNQWKVGSHRLTIDREAGRAHALSAWINVYGVPVLWLPYLSVPLNDDRATGLLAPTLKFSDGFLPTQYSQPLYLNLAPNYDATLTSHWLRDVGFRPQAEIRYLTANASGQLDFSRFFASQGFIDQQVEQYASEDKEPPLLDNRWFWQFQHQGRIGSDVDYQIKAADASDPLWADNFEQSDAAVNHHDQYAKINWRRGSWHAGLLYDQDEPAKAEEDIVAADVKWRRWPQINLGYATSIGAASIKLDNEYTQFNKREYQDIEPATDFIAADRLNTSLTSSYSWGSSLPGRGEIKLNRIQHWLTDETDERLVRQSSLVPQFKVSQAIQLTNSTQAKWQTKLSPSLTYLYVPLREDQVGNPAIDLAKQSDQYSNPQRFNGGDAIGDMQRIQFSLSNSWSIDGQQRLSLSASQAVKLAQERLNITSGYVDLAEMDEEWQPQPTGIQLKANFTPEPSWAFSGLLEYGYKGTKNSRWLDHNSYELTVRDFAMHYGADRQFINLAWRTENTDKQDENNNTILDTKLDSSMHVRLSEQLGVMAGAKWHNDKGDRENVELRHYVAGLEWDNCCVNWRVVYQTDVDPKVEEEQSDESEPADPFASVDDGWFFEVRLKGVVAHGEGIDELLSQFKGYTGKLFNFR